MAPAVLEQLIQELQDEEATIAQRAGNAATDDERECLERCRQLTVTCGVLARLQLETTRRVEQLARRTYSPRKAKRTAQEP